MSCVLLCGDCFFFTLGEVILTYFSTPFACFCGDVLKF